jgi:predicted dinucleotide-binding enzyme
MSYAIVGAGNVGQALAKAFARQGIEVLLASRRSPEALAPIAAELGSSVVPTSLKDAAKADIVFLATPYGAHDDVATAAASWRGKIIVDVSNAYGVPPEDLGGLPSSVVVSQAFPGAKLVKAFNHLPAKTLADDPKVEGGRRVIFVSSDHDDAATQVSDLVEQLGFAPVALGKLTEGGLLVQARGKTWAPLIFKDLFKREG